LFHDENNNWSVSEAEPTEAELKVLHRTIKKVQDDIERFSFNTAVSSFMICANELQELKCNKRTILEPLTVLISSYAPHMAEELWNLLGNSQSVSLASFPVLDEKYLVDSTFDYPVSFNGKMRFNLSLPLDMSKEDVENAVLANEKSAHYLEGKTPKKVIVVIGKIVNIVF
jgi:leucyl-tRNA synthetase